jgi:hypothetical protein
MAGLLSPQNEGDEVLAEIAHDLLEAIRGCVTIDRTQKEAMQADMRRKVKRLLRKHGYPHIAWVVLPQAYARRFGEEPFRSSFVLLSVVRFQPLRSPAQFVEVVGDSGGAFEPFIIERKSFG